MDIEIFEIKAELVRKAKERCVLARAGYDAAVEECNAAMDAERAAYKDFTRFVRESAGLKPEFEQ